LIHKLKRYKKGGIIAESKHINEIETLCPKCDLMRALFERKKRSFEKQNRSISGTN
jgi:hypothetical protein